MKSIITLSLFVLTTCRCAAQTYIAVVPALVNAPGTMADRTNLSLEVGRQFGVFSVGADIGKTHMGKSGGRDTTVYMELRPNLNIFEHGKFTNTLTIGIGGVFNAHESFMTEFSTGIEYEMNEHYHFNANFGNFYYSGLTSSRTVTFFGLSIMHYFGHAHQKALIDIKGKTD